MASATDNNAFLSALFPGWLLDDAIEWIEDNLAPDDVFDIETLDEWAEANGWVRPRRLTPPGTATRCAPVKRSGC